MWTGVGHSRFSFLVRSLNDVAPLELRSSICAGHLGPEAISPKDLSTMMVSSRIACRSSRLRQANNNASKSGRRRTYERTDGRNAKQQHGKKSVKNSLQKRIIREKVRRRISYITFCWKLDPKAFTSRWHCHYTTTALLSIRPISDLDRLLYYC